MAIITLLPVLVLNAAIGATDDRPERFTQPPIEAVKITDSFWTPKRERWRTTTITDVLDKLERDGALKNFDIVSSSAAERHHGPPWLDGLLYEAICGASEFLRTQPDTALQQRLEAISLRVAAAAAKDPAGYINTYTWLEEPTHRWGMNGGNLRWQHDVYNAGCLVEAGVQHYRATGSLTLLQVAVTLANHMCDLMGPPPRTNIVPGHALPELAMLDLWQLFQEQPALKDRLKGSIDQRRYIELAQFWIDYRGKHDGRASLGSYAQDARPVAEQPAIEGHAVRATLLGAGIAALAIAADREDYRRTAHQWWTNMVQRRMYITGGVGAIAEDERFGDDFELPNTGYLETCASVSSAMFHHRMNLLTADAKYADELERSLYNGVLGGVALDGAHYCYENPLDAGPERTRWSWHGCPCCPPMFLKIMGAMPSLIYATDHDTVAVNLYVGSTIQTRLGKDSVAITQTTDYPWSGDVLVSIDHAPPQQFELAFRVPGWCQLPQSPDPTQPVHANDLYLPLQRPRSDAFRVRVNGEDADAPITNGYARIQRAWKKGDRIDITMDMVPQRVFAREEVLTNRGLTALMRGPLVYSLESTDNNGLVRNIWLQDDAPLFTEHDPALLGGVTTITAAAHAAFVGEESPRIVNLTAVPYYATANRGPSRRVAWIPRIPERATAARLEERATPAASHQHGPDPVAAMNDGVLPRNSHDESLPRFTWWDHRGTAEWVQYTFATPQRIAATEVYWWDEGALNRHCRVPQSWRLLYLTPSGEWKEVAAKSEYGLAVDRFNRVEFAPVETTAIRIETQLQKEWSGGILEWRVDGVDAK